MSGIRIRPVFTQPSAGIRPEKATGTAAGAAAGGFEKVLDGAIGGDAADLSAAGSSGIHFSKHAQGRLSARGIELGGQELERLGGALEEASRKGVQDSLVVMGSLAFIVSVPDKTVVTAMPVNEAGATVFTNIDGAVIA